MFLPYLFVPDSSASLAAHSNAGCCVSTFLQCWDPEAMSPQLPDVYLLLNISTNFLCLCGWCYLDHYLLSSFCIHMNDHLVADGFVLWSPHLFEILLHPISVSVSLLCSEPFQT
jgi:hypothetical protein